MSLYHRIILGLAGLTGATGVALSATAAHVAGGETLTLAAPFLILHAAAAIGAIAIASRGAGASSTALTVAAAALLLGPALFSGDLALRALAGSKLLWGTAPWGGSLTILGWLGVAAGALLRDRGAARRD